MVLLGIALFLLYAAGAASRSTQEARISKLKVHAEKAHYAAEAGFNRVRAAVVACMDYHYVTGLDGYHTELNGAAVDVAVVGITETPIEVQITSTAVYGNAPWQVTRTLSGTVQQLSDFPPCDTLTTYN